MFFLILNPPKNPKSLTGKLYTFFNDLVGASCSVSKDN